MSNGICSEVLFYLYYFILPDFLARRESKSCDAAIFWLFSWFDSAELWDLYSTWTKLSKWVLKTKLKNKMKTNVYPRYFNEILAQLTSPSPSVRVLLSLFPDITLKSLLLFWLLWPFLLLSLLQRLVFPMVSSLICLWRSFLCPFFLITINVSLAHTSPLSSAFCKGPLINDVAPCEPCNIDSREIYVG